MRFMMMVRADANTEAGTLPTEQELTEMGAYNEQLARAGVLLAGEGLQPSSKGARVRFSGGGTTVIDGPFTETRELIAGFWLIQVRSREEAIEWARRSGMSVADGPFAESRKMIGSFFIIGHEGTDAGACLIDGAIYRLVRTNTESRAATLT